MKAIALSILLSMCTAAQAATLITMLDPPKPGEMAPAFKLNASDGGEHSLTQYRGRIVILEWTNTESPAWQRVHESEGAMRKAYEETRKIDETVVWLAINSTWEATARQNNAARKSYEIEYPILMDSDGAVGKAYGARTTPHMFVIDSAGKLAYYGAIDNDPFGKRAEAKEKVNNYVVMAVRALHEGKEIKPAKREPYGSPVRYRDAGGAGKEETDAKRDGGNRTRGGGGS